MKKAKLFMMLALLVMGVSNLFAQNVTISPTTGNLVAALTTGDESGFAKGFCSLWRHEQLPLSFTVSDFCNLTEGGELRQPAGNMTKNGDYLVVDGGVKPDSYMCLSLPKGYRFTGYKIVLANNLVNQSVNETNHTNTGNKVFYETTDLSYLSSTQSMNYDYINDEGQYNNVVFQINAGNPTYPAVAKNERGNFEMAGQVESGYYTIERTSLTEDDMDNHLYFRLSHSSASGLYGLTIVSFEVWFTAEGTFNTAINNQTSNGTGVARSVVTSSFKTSKIDIGAVQRRTKGNSTYFAYSYQNVRDLDAYNYIYQEDAVIDGDGNLKHNGEPVEGEETKTIYPVRVNNQYRFAFGNNTYFAEPPISVTTTSGLTAPIGYRIVGAEFTPLAGSKTSQGSITIPAEGYYIYFTSGSSNRYLYKNGQNVAWSTSSYTQWILDSETQGLYTEENGTRYYLACEGEDDNYRTLSLATAAPSSESGTPGYHDLILFEHDGNTYIGWDSENPENRWYLRAWRSSRTNYSQVTKGNTTNVVRLYENDTETTTPLPDFDPGSYTLTVYGTDKDTPVQTVTVNGSAAPITLNNLNNDAVKFEVSGLAEGKMALFNVSLKLQFLNPYIDKMNIVCHDPADQFTLTQTFTANDFSVAGGEFDFFVPDSKKNSLLTLTFSDLYSKYGDETYDHVSNTNPGNSRYNFVKSQHNDVLGDDIYNAKTEAASATLESARLSSKQNVRTQVKTVGNIRFKFNNAEDLTNTQTNTGTKYLEETPFTLAGYLATTDPDGKISGTGQFIPCQLKAASTTQNSGTYYVFTTDETRYNIAPTTAWQHRYYAFYRMKINLRAEDFNPIVTPVEVYDTTYYRDAKDNRAYLPQYGVKLSTKETITIDDGNGGNKQSKGYLTAGQIGYQLNQLKKTNKINPDQILYIDGSELLSIVEIGDSTISLLKSALGKNALIFLPENTTSTLDNFAFKTQSGTFRAGKDIVITDKQPFFSPYDIQIDNANFAMYDRKITTAQNGKVYNGTIVLPFTIDLNDDHQHVNQVKDKNGKTIGAPFSLYTMADDKELKKVKEFDNEVVQFFEIFEGKESEANKPYVVHVYGDGEDQDSNNSFKVRCKGSLVVATGDPNAASFDNTKSGYFYNETAGGTYDGAPYSFKHTGTYRGYTFKNAGDPATKEQIFYFAEDCFYTSKTLRKNEPMYVQPFRSYYDYTTTSSGAKLTKFRLAFSDIDEMGGTNGIDEIKRDVDLAVIPGNGNITLMARADKDVTIHAVNGMTVDKCSLRAGETRTVSVPAGVYVINGVKMVVK